MESLPNAGRPAAWGQVNWTNIVWWSVFQAGVVFAPFTFTWSGLTICVVLYFVSALGVSAGYHRLLTHRSFRTSRAMEYLLTTLGCVANQGGPIQWVATHRIHHRHSDKEGDPHSPRDGWWWAHIIWWMPFSDECDDPARYERFAVDLVKDRYYRFLQRYQIVFPLALAVLLYFGGEAWGGDGFSWIVWGMFVRTTTLYHAIWFVNSAAHCWGYRTYPTRDRSTNVWWVALVAMGEGWHNNHHAFPRSARHGLRWWEVDFTYYSLCVMKVFGLVWQIHVPHKAEVHATHVEPPVEVATEGIPS